jgi:phage shock protein PspC (stress-responsive transcriptional regulator)
VSLRSVERQPFQWLDVVGGFGGKTRVPVHMLVVIFVIRCFVSVLLICLLIYIIVVFLPANPSQHKASQSQHLNPGTSSKSLTPSSQ